MTQKKGTKAKQQTRGNSAPRPKQHTALCSVCKHVQREEIEAAYLRFESAPKLAEEFGLNDDAIYRHAEYFGLDVQRISDTERVLENIIARGFVQMQEIPPKVWMDSVKELNKMRGKHKLPDENPQAAERFKRRYERAIEKYIAAKVGRGEGCSREEAIAALGQIEPEINDYVN